MANAPYIKVPLEVEIKSHWQTPNWWWLSWQADSGQPADDGPKDVDPRKDVGPKSLWEILVPTQWSDGRPIHTRHHRVWDAKVMALSGGLTILTPSKGKWDAPDGQLVAERMIPVRVACSEADIERIADITAKHYEQAAVMYWRVSDFVRIKAYGPSASGGGKASGPQPNDGGKRKKGKGA